MSTRNNNNKKKKKKSKSSNSNKDNNHGITKSAVESNINVKNAINQLGVALQELNDASEDTKMSHWRDIPEDVNSAYKMLQEGAEIIKATSTKFTLVGKISMEDGSKLAEELQKGCELLATGALLVHQPSIGCVRSTRTHTKRAARGVVASVSSLIQCFLDQTAYISHKQIGAQKTGAVWSACDAVQKIPKGNRSAMRRDLLTWAMECNETMQEFEQLVQQSSTTDDSKQEDTEDENDDSSWEDFCNGAGTGETYQKTELPLVNACLGLIKCSRGTINAVLQTCESAGDQTSNIGNIEEEQAAYKWINKLHDTCRNVGENMTDLGSLLYPPLQIGSNNSQQNTNGNTVDDNDFWSSFGEIGTQILHQQRFISTTLQMILNSPKSILLSQELVDFVNKLITASQKRFDDAKAAILQVQTST